MLIRTMTIADYDRVCALWMSSPNMVFTVRGDLNYRNFTFDEMIRIDT